jgi:hypothetical protein
MKLFVRTTGLIAVSVIWFVGCGILPTPIPTPTPTAVPTDTPTAAPTNTATPRPSATPPTANALPSAIAFALNKTQGARTLNYDFSTGITAVQGGKKTELPGLALKGQDSTLNRHVTISGTTSDTNEFITYEVIVFGENTYVKGLTGIPGIDPTVWYVLPAELQANVRRLPTARALLGSFDAQDFADAKFQRADSETMDGEQCTIWSAQAAATIQKIIGVTESDALKKQLGEIDSSELKVWTCADGYIHQIEGLVQGHSAQTPSDTVSINLHFHMNQFDEALNIQAPSDAKPFQPQSSSGSATPTLEKSPAGAATPTSAPTQTTPTPTPKP